ncbi:MAG: efflux RND transporter periplasmic adaptor subunit [Nitrospirae bacterium]|nr:MAG: efflux RND transporter periplasmic adaptor subunit [Nitrospirota bacterium]
MSKEDLSKLKIEKSADAFKARGRRRRIFWLVFAAVAAAAVIFLFKAGFFSPAIDVQAVSVSKVYPSQTFTLLNGSGYVAAQRKAAVASKTTGRLVWLGVEEGNKVKKGQILARLENEDVLASREQARANLSVAQANLEQAKAELHDATVHLEREKNLLKEGFTTKSSYDTADARHKKARAAADSAEASINANKAAIQGTEVSLEYATIRAPFDGVVLTKSADIGDIVTPIGAAANAKAAVVTIADMNSLYVEVDVSESNISKVKAGQPCEIQLDALPDTRLSGVVHMVVPTADRSKASVLVKVKFLKSDSRILPEMSAKVAFLERQASPEEQRPRTAVSHKAIVSKNGTSFVYKVMDNRALETVVKTGAQLGDMIEILEGLQLGDKVVVSPPAGLKNEKKIKIQEK